MLSGFLALLNALGIGGVSSEHDDHDSHDHDSHGSHDHRRRRRATSLRRRRKRNVEQTVCCWTLSIFFHALQGINFPTRGFRNYDYMYVHNYAVGDATTYAVGGACACWTAVLKLVNLKIV